MTPARTVSPAAARLPAALSLALLGAALLAGCAPTQAPADGASREAETETPRGIPHDALRQDEAPAAPADTAGRTIGGDGSEIRLDGLGDADVAGAELSGELACTFSAGDDERNVLLYATGIVGSADPAQGVVKVAGYVERIHAPGGFDGMVGGATFAGQGKTIGIAPTGAASGGGESPPRPATLTYQRADGASRIFAGHWRCGP